MKKHLKTPIEFIGEIPQNKDIIRIFDIDDKYPTRSYKMSESKHTEGYIDVTCSPSWVDSNHVLYDTKLLSKFDKKYIFYTNEFFKGILYDPQATLLAAMIDLENKQCLNIMDGSNSNLAAASLETAALAPSYVAHTRSGVLSVKFSFGKTVLALALICAQKIPLNKEIIYPLSVIQSSSEIDNRNRMNVITDQDPIGRNNYFTPLSNWGFFPEIELYEDNMEFIPISIVAAATSIITQWENNIKQFTNLRYFIIDNVHSLKKFEILINNSNIKNYDIILIKIGHVTHTYRTVNEIANNIHFTTNRTIFSAIISILKGKKISRFIIDDFDVIKLTGNDYLINACFTWFISATRRQSSIKLGPVRGNKSIEQYLLNALEAPAITYTSDDVLNKAFNIRCDPEYINEHINTTNVIFRKIVVKGSSTKIFQNLNIAPEIIEMINADAVGLAAQSLGLEVNTIGDLIRSITGNHISEMKYSLKILNRIEQALQICQIDSLDVADAIDVVDVTDVIDDINIDAVNTDAINIDTINAGTINTNKYNSIQKIILHTGDEDFHEFICGRSNYVDIKNNEINIKSANSSNVLKLTNLKIRITAQYEKNVMVLNRMRDNIREGYCQCCTLPFEENCAYVLGNCCQIIICEECITVGANKSKTFIKKCPNCAAELTYGANRNINGLIKVGNSVNLEDALADDIVLTIDESISPHKEDDSIASASIANLKIRALLQLLRSSNKITDNYCISDNIIAPTISGLLVGKIDIPHTGRNKYLIFSLLTETTHFLHNELSKHNVEHLVLQGNKTQKNNIIESFKNNIDILLITATNDCAGLHLPFVSHIIFYHKIIDHNIESQIAARGQRLGRIANLEIIYLLYQYE
jgi:hypothetical protein